MGGSDSLVTVEKGDASPASKRKRGPVIEQKEVATIVAELETGKSTLNAKITEERPKSEEAKQNDKVKSSKLLAIADKLSKSQTPATDDKEPKENVKVAKAVDEKPAEKVKAAKPIDEQSAEKVKAAKPIDEKSAEKIKLAKPIEQKSEEKIKVPKAIEQKPAEKIRVPKPIDEKHPEKVKSPKVKPSEKVNLPKILLIPPKILEPKPAEKIKSSRLVLETKPADKIKVAKAIDKKTTENIKMAKPIEQKPAEKIKIKIYDAKPLPEKVKSPKPEKVKSPKPEKEKVKSPKVMAQSTEINDNRYVVQSVAANPLKIKLKTGSFGSDLDMVKAPLKLKVSLKDCSSSGELSGG